MRERYESRFEENKNINFKRQKSVKSNVNRKQRLKKGWGVGNVGEEEDMDDEDYRFLPRKPRMLASGMNR